MEKNETASAQHCEYCGSEIDPWGFGIPLEEALDHQLAAVRFRAQLKQQLDRYCSMSLAEKIRLAMEILWDVCDEWDHDNLVHYPENMPSFDEYLAEIGSDLYAISWKESSPNDYGEAT